MRPAAEALKHCCTRAEQPAVPEANGKGGGEDEKHTQLRDDAGARPGERRIVDIQAGVPEAAE